jgi:DNA polymerase-3 subunit delta'
MRELSGTENHPHARMVLGAALAAGEPSHAYLFHGPPGTGKRTVARALAAELLAEGSEDPDNARLRAQHGTHPDLTWVVPSGAHVMRVDDVEEAVVGAATRTPFESRRRVFVLERVDTMNDEVANRLLKTLEEPAAYVHLILLTDAPGQVLPTVVSRCQLVRFDPLPADRIAARLVEGGVPEEEALACARLALGNASRARHLTTEEGRALRAEVAQFVRAALGGQEREAAATEPWRALHERAVDSGEAAKADADARTAERLEIEPKGRERRAIERELEESGKRDQRRASTEVLDLGLELTALSFRDLACISEGAEEAVLGTDSAPALAAEARGRDSRRFREAMERCEDTRLSLSLNVSADLALSALGFRLERLVGSGG